MTTDDGQSVSESIYANAAGALKVFQVGRRVEVEYLFDELKDRAPNGQATYLDIVFRVSIED